MAIFEAEQNRPTACSERASGGNAPDANGAVTGAVMVVGGGAGIGLMILTGHTGQVSFGHAAFLGIGAYTHSVLLSHGVPFLLAIPITVLFTGVIGMLIGVILF